MPCTNLDLVVMRSAAKDGSIEVLRQHFNGKIFVIADHAKQFVRMNLHDSKQTFQSKAHVVLEDTHTHNDGT